ncbi:MAG: DUF2207 domain-containing protein [Ilumatobacteraceae bacterium]|nr:DUF2207 domain-containing protein [Ilumatobacteraceae bacterium]
MIGGVSKIRHTIVGATIGGTTLLAGTGVIGGGSFPERFDAKTVVVAPVGDGLRITEFVDIDFGNEDRRGYERVIPNDFGAPIDVEASSPDANGDVGMADLVGSTRIRVGDPDTTFTGQHRYELSYTLPDARFDLLGLDLDIVAPKGGAFPGDDETGRFEVIVTGFVLDDTFCDIGSAGATGGCELVPTDDVGTYRAVIEPLEQDAGLSIGGTIVERTDPVDVEAPAIPERRDDPNTGLLALGVAALGTAGAVPVYRRARRRGRNEVFAGGAADAAYGDLPAPRLDGTVAPAPPVRLVADDDMADLATIEFVPPKGIEPWEASVLLDEQVGNDTVEAWISGLVAKKAIKISEEGDELSIRSGSDRKSLDEDDARLLSGILDIDDPYTTGTYDPQFAAAWSAIRTSLEERIASSGWWKHLPPGSGLRPKGSRSPFGLIMIVIFVLIWSGSAASAFFGAFRSLFPALALGLLLPAVVAYFVYRALLPARSAQGSALALRAESFRRFLHASEGKHVEWAWSQRILREYSAWAVALGEAEAWSKALENANVPERARAVAGPVIIVHSRGSSMRDTRTAPSSSGGGGGGYSGGGGVGGGGGGGSSGSW